MFKILFIAASLVLSLKIPDWIEPYWFALCVCFVLGVAAVVIGGAIDDALKGDR